MKKLNKVALLFAVTAMAGVAGAQTRPAAAGGGNRLDNWTNGSGELVWRNGTNEYCWRDAGGPPATAAAGCDGALVPPPPPPPPTAAPAPAPTAAPASP